MQEEAKQANGIGYVNESDIILNPMIKVNFKY